MKKTLLTLPLFFLCCWFCGYGQTPDWVWARGALSNSAGNGEGISITTDKSNNVYITGFYNNTITFGSFILTSTNPDASYLAKYDASGNVLWAKSAVNNVNGMSVGWSVCTDVFGNAYLTGYFLGAVSFGSYTLTSAGGYDIFLVKYDSSGNVLWAKSAGGTSSDAGSGVSTDPSGNAYLTGYFSSASITFGSFSLNNVGNGDIFLAKYDSIGNVLWAKSAGGSGGDGANSIATDTLSNVYITGAFSSSLITFGPFTLTNVGSGSIFLAKYDSSGNVVWAKNTGGTGSDEGYYVVADVSGNAYLTGRYSSPSIIFGADTLVNMGGYDAFLARYDSSGNVRWAKGIGGTVLEQGFCVAIDKSYRTYITGGFTSPSLTFDSITVQRPAVSTDPMFVAGYDSSGRVLWAKALASGGDDNNAVAASPSGCIYIGGDFEPASFIVGNDTLINSGASEEVFVAKLCYSGLTAFFNSSNSILCAEPTPCINFFDQSYGNPTSWQWHFTGANPDTSSLQNPDSICYSAAGTYPVQLIVSNGTVTDTLTVASMIIVGGTPVQPTISIVGGDTLISSHGSAYQWYLNGSIITGATDSFYVEHQGGTYSVQITDQYGCQSFSSGTVLSVDELSGGVGVAVYPNPFTNELIASPPAPLQGRGEWEFTLFDVTSRVLLHRLFTNQVTINTEQLARGMYFYEVRDKNGVREMGKVVKE